jgi:hypothetical protein
MPGSSRESSRRRISTANDDAQAMTDGLLQRPSEPGCTTAGLPFQHALPVCDLSDIRKALEMSLRVTWLTFSVG